ncbi:hypothetical protein [Marinomonas mediterranea]|uniref:Uncharacterized protein n=1 Tax=Marinomonas mediterranea (strain ATCC 700492 / JCM 21426 / NBRC 103028 / MMB-1) TaxID=717774 RepID=F2K1J6_MARM1|nr:hypothetical protein [Marinomonas mediterranea]ADZ92226.1 hypothetical protein Marme_3005 [Marinomonas mediterranea MMB-1]WCN10184.1 hypothetical protein GV055_15345 [Marinomonas mediterranea]WCN14229.1 hypothetical protein GV054_15130 [Marinomonas mediterranea]WCN18285.1 hypothetical protein GV053_15220 [Marinomonas mediterranea MMB-1]
MNQKTVADALNVFYELGSALSDAYWETNDIDNKDIFFAMKLMLQEELDELHKLSMQDHIYPYEPINPNVVRLSGKLRTLHKGLDDIVYRPQTLMLLEELIPSACDLFEK